MKTTLATGKFLTLFQEGHWEYVTRENASGAVVIVAVTDDHKILLVEQYRIPVHSVTIELPAGIVGDEPGRAQESFLEAAQRELLEETGFAADRITVLSTGPSSGGLTSELITLVLASGLRRRHAGGGVAHENITVHEIPLRDVQAWLASKEKAHALVEPKVYAGLYFFLERNAKINWPIT